MRPRSEGGETSATYMGDRMEAPPTASPPMKRARTKVVKSGAAPVEMEVAANSTATHNRMLRRPYRFVSRPATVEPITQPNRSELKAHPTLTSFNRKRTGGSTT